ncbi:MAG: glycosyltransferase family 39 protein [Deltaproteobacteria bacterium]|nr:glycosyltransferase family 39 protein [Deltaproteobacteria bacterium]
MNKDNKNKIILIVLIVVVALALRLAVLFALPPVDPVADAREYDELALSILAGNGFARPDGEPTAFRPPLYPAFLALIYFVFGHHYMPVQLIQAVLLALTCALAFLIGREIYSERVACIAGIGCAFYPMLILPAYEILSEALFVFLFTLTLFLLLKCREKRGLVPWAGFSLALASITKPFALFALPFFIYWLWRQRSGAGARSIALFVLVFMLCLVPWTVRNYRVSGKFVPIATVGGITFYNSYILAPQGPGFNSLEQVPPEFFFLNDEVAQSRYLVRHTVKYISDNPTKMLPLAFLKVFLLVYPLDGYWYVISLGSKYNVFWGLICCFSLFGIFFPGAKGSGKELILLTLLSVLLFVLVFAGIPRYRLFVEPILLLLGARGFVELVDRSRGLAGVIIGLNVLIWTVFRFWDPGLFQWSIWSHYF